MATSSAKSDLSNAVATCHKSQDLLMLFQKHSNVFIIFYFQFYVVKVLKQIFVLINFNNF